MYNIYTELPSLFVEIAFFEKKKKETLGEIFFYE